MLASKLLYIMHKYPNKLVEYTPNPSVYQMQFSGDAFYGLNTKAVKDILQPNAKAI